MTSTWQPFTNYFVKLNFGQTKKVIGSIVQEHKNYNLKKDESDRLLEDIVRKLKLLKANKVIFDNHMNDAHLDEIELKDGTVVNVRGVQNYITEEEFEWAKEIFSVTEFYTQEEYDAMEYIEEDI